MINDFTYDIYNFKMSDIWMDQYCNSFIVFVYDQIPSEFLLRKVEHKYIDNKSLAGGTNNRTNAEVGWPRHQSRADSQ